MKIKSIKNSNINIKKVLSQNQIIWQRPYKWKKYKLQSNYTYVNREVIKEMDAKDIDWDERVNTTVYTHADIVNHMIVLQGNSMYYYDIAYNPGKWYTKEGYYYYSIEVYYTSGNIRHVDTRELYIDAEYKKVFSHYSKGEFIEEVKSKNKNEYPVSGEKGGYWYEFIE